MWDDDREVIAGPSNGGTAHEALLTAFVALFLRQHERANEFCGCDQGLLRVVLQQAAARVYSYPPAAAPKYGS